MNLLKEITFFIHGTIHTVDATSVSPDTNLNSYLRNHLGLKGTKKMCMEGGCGACIVAIQKKNPISGNLETFAVNSCLISIFSCHNWNIFTIESLGNQQSPHPIQDTLTKFNGTQCGYCTPGMIMNLFPLIESNKITEKSLENSFGGNICRCTGYRSILTAFKTFCSDTLDIEDLQVCKQSCPLTPAYFKLPSGSWIKPSSFNEVLQVMKTFHNSSSYNFVSGNTSKGVYKTNFVFDIYVDLLNVKELSDWELKSGKLILGANTSLTNTLRLFGKIATKDIKFSYLQKLADHIDLIANVPVRNVGSLAGNLMIKHNHNEFPSDVFIILEAVGAVLEINDFQANSQMVSPKQFLLVNMQGKIIKNIIFSELDQQHYVETYKIMPRAQNAHALVNAAFMLQLNKKNLVEKVKIVYGCINPKFVNASKTEKFFIGKNMFDNQIIRKGLELLDSELVCDYVLPDPKPEFRKQLALALFYKFILSVAPKQLVNSRNLSGATKLQRPVSSGIQEYGTQESMYPVSKPISKLEALSQTTGEAEFITDIPDHPNQLYAAFVLAKAPANSVILNVNPDKALKIKGVRSFLDKHDIPGRNTFTPKEMRILPLEEELFCDGIVKFFDQPIGIIVATNPDLAEQAALLIEVSYKFSSEPPLLTVEDVLKSDSKNRIHNDRIVEPTSKGSNVKHTIKGELKLNWQYHYHMETQACSVVPTEDGLNIFPSSQWMDLSQTSASIVLGIPSNKINVYVRRIGGAFGAKIIRNAQISCACALAAFKLRKPVKMWLSLETNMSTIGKRHPILSNYEMATDEQGIIQYLNNTFYYNFGVGLNENVIFLLLETYFGCYNAETWYSNANFVNTDMHASCYMRAPGSLEGLIMVEAIMDHMASFLKMDPLEFRMVNLNQKEHPKLKEYILDLRKWADIDARKKCIEEFNCKNRWKKRGLSVVPMVYPFSFFLSYGVLVSIYQADGSVSVAHAGVEIGQGINTKAAQVCAFKLGVALDKVSIKPSNNLTTPNSQMTGASITSEGVCFAIIKACDVILARIKSVRDKMNNPTWEELIKQCYLENINLAATSLATANEPSLGNYDVYGVAAAEIELDILTGQSNILRVDLLEDVGDSMSPEIDIGQVEGAFIMGLGYLTCEEIITNSDGRILTNRTWNYKPPGAKDIPIDFRVKFPKNNPNPVGVLKSKATGEPPMCLAVSIPLAIRNAVASFREENGHFRWYGFDGPSSVENTFTNCLHDFRQYSL